MTLSSEIMTVITVCIVLVVILYLLTIFWSIRDANNRGQWAFGLIAIIPFLGLIAYCLIRPPLLEVDREEQDLELTLKQRQLMKYGDCGNCGYPVEADYVMCPNCHQRLKNLCPTCHHALEPTWTICPYCTTPIGNGR